MVRQTEGAKSRMTRLILTLIVGLWSASVQAIELKSVRSSADQDSSRVVLELSGRPQFSSFNLSNPSRLVLDVSNLQRAQDELQANFNSTAWRPVAD